MKKIIVLILCLTLALAAAACAKPESADAPPPETSAATTPETFPQTSPTTSTAPSPSPSATPSSTPASVPSATPSAEPSASSSAEPSPTPSDSPASIPSIEPSPTPSATSVPSPEPSPEPPAEPEKSAFENIGGVLTTVDLENSPFDGSGLKIEIKHGSGGYVKFTKVGLDGTETVDYYMFMPSQMLMEKHYYVSAMGMDYYYTYDLSTRELLTLENGSREDVSESSKNAGRWDSAAETVKTEVEMLEGYFSAQFGFSIYAAFNDESFGA